MARGVVIWGMRRGDLVVGSPQDTLRSEWKLLAARPEWRPHVPLMVRIALQYTDAFGAAVRQMAISVERAARAWARLVQQL